MGSQVDKRPRGICPVCFLDVALRLTGHCAKHPETQGPGCQGTGRRALKGVIVRPCRKNCGSLVCYPRSATVTGIAICEKCRYPASAGGS